MFFPTGSNELKTLNYSPWVCSLLIFFCVLFINFKWINYIYTVLKNNRKLKIRFAKCLRYISLSKHWISFSGCVARKLKITKLNASNEFIRRHISGWTRGIRRAANVCCSSARLYYAMYEDTVAMYHFKRKAIQWQGGKRILSIEIQFHLFLLNDVNYEIPFRHT